MVGEVLKNTKALLNWNGKECPCQIKGREGGRQHCRRPSPSPRSGQQLCLLQLWGWNGDRDAVHGSIPCHSCCGGRQCVGIPDQPCHPQSAKFQARNTNVDNTPSLVSEETWVVAVQERVTHRVHGPVPLLIILYFGGSPAIYWHWFYHLWNRGAESCISQSWVQGSCDASLGKMCCLIV